MIKYFFAGFILPALLFQKANAQYYYKDIVSVKQANTEKKALQDQQVRNIIVHGFESDGTPSEGFHCEKKISKNFRTVETHTSSPGTSTSVVNATYNDQGWLLQSSDSSEITAASTIYEYDGNGNISSITSYTHSSDDDFSTSLKEVHRYTYNDKDRPVKMMKIKNDKDSVQVDFILDEKGNITDEIEPGINGRHYYYYYNESNQLTDIVKYNAVKKGLRADFIFEYDDAGRVIQMISVEEGISGDYLIWRYTYNEGLRIIEKCYSKDKKLLGYFEYEYD